MKTSVIILNWNGKELLQKFLPSVVSHSQGDGVEVVVADNGSDDNSVEYLRSSFPEVRLITLDKNWGFAEGYNLAIEQTDAEYVVLLNSDIETTEGWLQPLTDYMDSHPEVAAVQPKIRAYHQPKMFEYAGAAGGFIDRYGYPFCRGRIFGEVEEDRGQYDNITDIFWATGACLFIRRSDYIDAGGLDSRFFAHMEEIDLCWRLNARGRKIACVPDSVVYHVGGASLNKSNPHKTYLNFRNNLLMLYKNLPDRELRSVMPVRGVFDFIAWLQFVLKFKFKDAAAVVRARCHYRRMRHKFTDNRKQNLDSTVVNNIPGLYRDSLLISYFLKGKKTFDRFDRF